LARAPLLASGSLLTLVAPRGAPSPRSMACRSIAAVLAALMVTLSEGMKCPGSPAWIHASAKVYAIASGSCEKVREEIIARVSAQGQDWQDPHNGGTYKLLSSNAGILELSRTTAKGNYTDKMVLTLNELQDDAQCAIEACSESQVTSVADFSTNYCNLRMLYCSSADGCKTVMNEFNVEEQKVTPSLGAGKDPQACLVKKELRVVQPSNSTKTISDAMSCITGNCPMDPVSMSPSKWCLFQNCSSKLRHCIFDATCRNFLLCEHTCTSPLANSTDAERFVAVSTCLQEKCPAIPVSKSCVALHCTHAAVKCAEHKMCRQTLECSSGCFPSSSAVAILEAAKSGGLAAKEGVDALTV